MDLIQEVRKPKLEWLPCCHEVLDVLEGFSQFQPLPGPWAFYDETASPSDVFHAFPVVFSLWETNIAVENDHC